MSVMASQITSLTIVSTVYWGAGQRKHQGSASLAFVRGFHWCPVNSSHKGPVTRKSFHLMTPCREELDLWNEMTCLIVYQVQVALRRYKNPCHKMLWLYPKGSRCLFNGYMSLYCSTVLHIECHPGVELGIRRSRNSLFFSYGMMMSSNGNIFRVTGPLCGEFAGHRWNALTNASDAELWCFPWFAPWINGWVNNRASGDLRRYRADYDVIVMDPGRGKAK